MVAGRGVVAAGAVGAVVVVVVVAGAVIEVLVEVLVEVVVDRGAAVAAGDASSPEPQFVNTSVAAATRITRCTTFGW